MAWGSIGQAGTVQSKVADQASLVLTLTNTIEAGNVAVLIVAVDNFQTTDGDEGAVSSISDSAGGNTWTKAVEFCNGQGAAQAGATVSIWFSKLTNQIPGGTGTITANFTNNTSRDASGATVIEFTVGAGNSVSVAGSPATRADDGVDPGALTISGLTSAEYLWMHGLAAEGPNTDAYTFTANYTSDAGGGTTGGAAVSNMHVRGEYRILTATTDTVDMTSTTADRDYAQAYVALQESAAPATTYKLMSSMAMMGAGMGGLTS